MSPPSLPVVKLPDPFVDFLNIPDLNQRQPKSSFRDSLLTSLSKNGVLQTRDFQEEHISILAKACSVTEEKCIRKVATFFAEFFGVLSAKLVLEHIQSEKLKEKFTKQIIRCSHIYTALKEGRDFVEISKLEEVKKFLSKVIKTDRTREIVQREISLCLDSLPMAALDSSLLISKSIPLKDIVLMREKGLSLARCLYGVLDKKTPIEEIADQQVLEIESFCHRGWGFTESNYIPWLTIILQWQARFTQTEHVQKLLDRFRFSMIRNQIPETIPNSSIGFRQYSINLTLDILEDRIKIEIPDVIKEVLKKELLTNELLRQEIFLWPSTSKVEKTTKYGSQKFNEILECIGRVSQLQMKNGSAPLVLEWIYFADLETKLQLDLLLHRENFSPRQMEVCTQLTAPFHEKKYPAMKLILLLYDHPEAKEICDVASKALEKNTHHFDQFLVYFLQQLMPVREFSSYEEIYRFLENGMESLGCSDTFSKGIFEILESIKKDHLRKERVTEFVDIFRKLNCPLPREIVFRALFRFIEGKFILKHLQDLKHLDCFLFTPADQIELFAEVLPPFPDKDKNLPQFLECVNFSMTLYSKYKFSTAETCRLFLQFFSFNLTDLQVFYDLIVSLEKFVKALLKKSFVFDLFYSNPIRTSEALASLKAMITTASSERKRLLNVLNKPSTDFQGETSLITQCRENLDIVLRLVDLRNDAIFPLHSENWIQFMNIQSFDDECPILSPSAMPLLNTFFLVNPDLPLGRIMLCRWRFTGSLYFEMFMLDPAYLEARSCKFYLDISLREKSVLKLLYCIAEVAGREKNFKDQLEKILKENTGIENCSDKILQFIEEIKNYYRFFHLNLMETRQEEEVLYCAQSNFVKLDSARQSQIEALRSDRRGTFPVGKAEEEDRFGKVAASPNSQNLTGCSIPKVFGREHFIYSTSKNSPAKVHPNTWRGDAPIGLPEPVMEKLTEVVKVLKNKQALSLNSLDAVLKIRTHTDLEFKIWWSFNPENKNEVTFKIPTAEIAWCYGDMIDHPNLENIVQLHLLMLLSHHYDK